jgi:enoyl-CoA hydratase/carnithine racemase
MGLINRIVPPSEVNALAQRQAQKLAAKPMTALLESKRLLKHGNDTLVAERMTLEFESFGRMLEQPAAREAFAAFMEKRKPDFSSL